MGLFKKRSNDTDQVNQLRAEITAMAARLDAADAEKTQLAHSVQHIATRLDQPPPEVPPPPPPIALADVDMMRARIQRLYDRLDASDSAGVDQATVGALEARVDDLSAQLAAALMDDADTAFVDPAEVAGIRTRLDAVSARLDEVAASAAALPPSDPPVDADEFATLRDRVEAISARLEARTAAPPPPPTAPPAPPSPQPAFDPSQLDDLRDRIERLHERIDEVDVRITSISTELANQISELAGDVDALQATAPTPDTAQAASADSGAIDGELVDELRDTQIKLANEQARYQIAFRQELADLAERLRRA